MSNDHGAAYWCDQYHKLEQENEKLKADVAMLREALKFVQRTTQTGLSWSQTVAESLSATASSDAWLKEQKAKVL